MPSKLGKADGHVENLLLQERVLFLTGTIDSGISDRTVAHLLYLDRENPREDIFMYVNSLGGYVTPGLAIYDTMKYIRPRIHTICMGWAMSMAAVLLSAGTRGCRHALPHASIMVHQPAGGMGGTVSDMERSYSEIVKIKKMLAQILAENTGQSLAKIEADVDRDFYLNAEEAVGYGLIDGVLKHAGELPDTTGSPFITPLPVALPEVGVVEEPAA